jgi:hypothetical protein
MAGYRADLRKIIVVGHSFVRRFGDFVRRDAVAMENLGLEGAEVVYHGYGGLKMDQLQGMVMARPGWTRGCFDVVVLMIGENDVQRSSTAAEIFRRLWELVLVVKAVFDAQQMVVQFFT